MNRRIKKKLQNRKWVYKYKDIEPRFKDRFYRIFKEVVSDKEKCYELIYSLRRHMYEAISVAIGTKLASELYLKDDCRINDLVKSLIEIYPYRIFKDPKQIRRYNILDDNELRVIIEIAIDNIYIKYQRPAFSSRDIGIPETNGKELPMRSYDVFTYTNYLKSMGGSDLNEDDKEVTE